MDVLSTFLNGKLDKEVYMNQPDGCVMPSNEHKMCYSRFDSSGSGVIICLYIDDMLILSINQLQVDETKSLLSSKFSMKDMAIFWIEKSKVLHVCSRFNSTGTSMITCLTDQLQVDEAESLMTSKFVMTDLGEVDVILGIRIKWVNKRIAKL
ncbi:hypothetical protein OSB04_006826 [Centaurea solstitialis]|uniref:Reverse transcriptase Ty1/copia-type domain-containing protein n=1 Tax=Centaurea solstitialis TaxID=347529 RepID=A0AA38WSX6_9ASTR|nr:hypothetical protein OSB04_006826 [Centaurea solstitialis]